LATIKLFSLIVQYIQE